MLEEYREFKKEIKERNSKVRRCENLAWKDGQISTKMVWSFVENEWWKNNKKVYKVRVDGVRSV